MHNFGKIKQIYNDLLSESIVSKNKDTRKVFGKYLRTIRENKVLRTQFLVYNNIENKIGDNDFKITEFIKANISLMESFDKGELKKLNENLFKALPKGVYNMDSNLYESINTLIFTKKSPRTIDTIIDATNSIVEHIKLNKPKVIAEYKSELPPSLLTAIYVDKYNERYSDLDESTLKLVKTILESDEAGRETLFTEIKKECVDLVNGKLSEGEEKEKLLAVKEKLLDMNYMNESHIEDISSLIELKNTLSE